MIRTLFLSLLLVQVCGCGNAGREPLPPQNIAEAASEKSWDEQLQKVQSGAATEIIVVDQVVTGEQFQELRSVAGKLKRLEIDQGKLTPTDWTVFKELTSLMRLKLGFAVGNQELQVLVQIPELRVLNLPAGVFSDVGLDSLAACQHLELFRFSSPHVTDAGLETIANLSTIRFLHLIAVPISDQGLESLAKMQQLESLYLDGCDVSDAALSKLLKELPGLHLHRDQLHLPEDPRAGHDD